MSHEIRTPMNAIVGFTDILMEDKLTPDQLDIVKTIKASGDNLLVIVNDILDFSKISAGKMPIESIDFDLKVCLNNIYNIFLQKMQHRKNIFSVNFYFL